MVFMFDFNLPKRYPNTFKGNGNSNDSSLVAVYVFLFTTLVFMKLCLPSYKFTENSKSITKDYETGSSKAKLPRNVIFFVLFQ